MKVFTDHEELIKRLSTEDINKLHDHLTDALGIICGSHDYSCLSKVVWKYRHVYGAFFLQTLCEIVLKERMREGSL